MLRSGMRLLDIGSGKGWPGLYLATHTECHVVLTDLPVDTLRCGVLRARGDGIASRCSAVAATGSQLPFAAGTFDAVLHADVLS